MNIVRATLDTLASMLSVRGDQIEDALASERLVKAGMSRRGFFRGTTAAAAQLALPSGLVLSQAKLVSARGQILEIRSRICQPFWDTLIRLPPIFATASAYLAMHELKSQP